MGEARAIQPEWTETVPHDELPAGTRLLHGQYTIVAFLNAGGFGITYRAEDSLGRNVVIKECFPGAFCRRSRGIVRARSRVHQNELKSIVRLFVQEAHSLSKLLHPNIVGVHQVFEENDTAYMALDFVDGRDMLEIADDPDTMLSPEQMVSTLRDLLGAIGFVHDQGMLHRDISPDNILLDPQMRPVLIDFGAARQQASKQSRVLSALRVVKDGYSPQEFYVNGAAQGPFSDLYALAASYYHLITGETPPDSQTRLTAIATGEPDPYKPLAGRTDGYAGDFLSALDKAMAVLPRERMQSAAQWLSHIDGAPVIAAATGNRTDAGSGVTVPQARAGRSRALLFGGVAAAAIAAVAVAVTLTQTDAFSGSATLPPVLAVDTPAALTPATPGASVSAAPAAIVAAVESPAVPVSPVVPDAGSRQVAANVPAVEQVASGRLAPPFAPATSRVPSLRPVAVSTARTTGTPTGVATGTASAGMPGPVPAEMPKIAGFDPVSSMLHQAVMLGPLSSTSGWRVPDDLPVDPSPLAGLEMQPHGAVAPGPEIIPEAVIPVAAATEAAINAAIVTEAVVAPEPEEPARPLPVARNGVLSGWGVALPFPDMRGDAEGKTRIVTLGGVPVNSRNDFNDVLRGQYDPAGRTQIDLTLGIRPGDGSAATDRTFTVPVVEEVSLTNGPVFQTAATADGWITQVVRVPSQAATDLQVGDIITGFVRTGQRMSGQKVLGNLLAREAAAGRNTFSFVVERDGENWIAFASHDGRTGE